MIYQPRNESRKEIAKIKLFLTRSLARMVLILLPVFGLTWLFGILAVNEDTLIFRYIFATFNSLQVGLEEKKTIYSR